MEKTIEIPEGYEARIEGNKVILEPKESEDERIRKELINLLSKMTDGIIENYTPIPLRDFIAYLEKQKEPKPVEWEWPNLSNCIKNCKKCHGKCFYRKEPYEEQKPAEWMEDERLKGQLLWQQGYETGKIAAKQEQKSVEWSEEDDAAHTRILGTVAKAFMGVLPTKPSEEDVHWLKTLPERFNLQPKQEWGEKDKNFIKELCDLLASIAKNNYVGRYYAPDLVSKLQSLRPHPHWKPSEEEMAALAEAMERNDKIGYLLHQLHEELKYNYNV